MCFGSSDKGSENGGQHKLCRHFFMTKEVKNDTFDWMG